MPRIYACPTPSEHCTGGRTTVNQFMRSSSVKYHVSSEDAYRCYRRYLIEVLEYKDMGNREFKSPDGGPRVFLAKKSKFGSPMRLGKEGARYMPTGKGRSGTIVTT